MESNKCDMRTSYKRISSTEVNGVQFTTVSVSGEPYVSWTEIKRHFAAYQRYPRILMLKSPDFILGLIAGQNNRSRDVHWLVAKNRIDTVLETVQKYILNNPLDDNIDDNKNKRKSDVNDNVSKRIKS